MQLEHRSRKAKLPNPVQDPFEKKMHSTSDRKIYRKEMIGETNVRLFKQRQ